MTKTHRDLPSIPADPFERRARIRWLIDHPLWTHEWIIPVPPANLPDEGLFKPSEDYQGCFEFVKPDDTWEIKDVRDGSWYDCATIECVHVNPLTETIEDDDNLNTAFRVWLESGGWHDLSTDKNMVKPENGWNKYNRWGHSHDPRLDCGADTMDEALLELARLVRFFYNDDGTNKEDAPEQCEGHFDGDAELENYRTGCENAGDGFCIRCGFAIED